MARQPKARAVAGTVIVANDVGNSPLLAARDTAAHARWSHSHPSHF
jgi:hypothetical protein